MEREGEGGGGEEGEGLREQERKMGNKGDIEVECEK